MDTFIISNSIDKIPRTRSLLISDDSVLCATLSEISKSVAELELINFGSHEDVVQSLDEIDVVFMDVRSKNLSQWENKKNFIVQKRKSVPNVAFVLIGMRNKFLEWIPYDDAKKYNHYYFMDLEEPFSTMSVSFASFVEIARGWHTRERQGKYSHYYT